jgi:hypothetical protein
MKAKDAGEDDHSPEAARQRSRDVSIGAVQERLSRS